MIYEQESSRGTVLLELSRLVNRNSSRQSVPVRTDYEQSARIRYVH